MTPEKEQPVHSIRIQTSFPRHIYNIILDVRRKKGLLTEQELIRYAVNYYLESQGYKTV